MANCSSSNESGVSANFHVDLETLRQWVDDDVIEAGIDDFEENRVVECNRDDTEVQARVEDEQLQRQMYVEVVFSGEDEPWIDCECEAASRVCRHAVAAMYAWEATRPASESAVESAADRAIAGRVRRAKREVEVEHLSGDGMFGSWRANTVSTDRPSSRPYRVEIRSLTRRANYCECPDFAHNRLGTCKHIEAVLHQIRKQQGIDEGTTDVPHPEHAFVYLD